MLTGVKPYVCKLCGKGFNQSHNLTVHMRSHASGQIPVKFPLEENSDGSSSTTPKKTLTKPEKRPFKCEVRIFLCLDIF